MLEIIQNNLPKYMSFQGVKYRLHLNLVSKNRVTILYVKYNGIYNCWFDQIFRRTYEIVQNESDIPKYDPESELKDATVYIKDGELAIIDLINDYNNILSQNKFEVLTEIVTDEVLFHRELTGLLKTYEKEFLNSELLATYLIQTIRTFKNTYNQATNH